jgi:lipopolysaccharide heptosyltransferase II
MHELRKVRQAIRKSKYDLVVDIHNSIRSRYVSAGLGNVARIRKRKFARFLLVKTKRDLYDWFGGAPSVAERYLEPVKHLGVQNDCSGLEVFVPEDISARATRTIRDSGIASGRMIIGLCPSAKHKNKMWPAERFAEVAAFFARKDDAAILLFGSGPDEKLRCGEIKARIEQSSRRPVLDFSSGTSLTETAALMDHCSVVITNDSGLMHLAAARKRKVLAIFGPTVQQLGFFPYGTRSIVIEDHSLPCRPCTHIGLEYCPKGHFKCMKNIEPSEVIEAAEGLLHESPET